MKKIVILGSTGMLGNAVYDVLKDKYDLVLTARSASKLQLLEEAHGDTNKHKFVEFDVLKLYDDYLSRKGYPGEQLLAFIKEIGEVDYIINAIGVTIPYSLENPAGTFFINSAFPHIMAREFGEKFIHITTDCVYNGKEGYPYSEESPKTAVDIYGLSKSLGEPTSCLTIRTSIIGKELEGFTGFLDWFLQQDGKEITGFAEHYWNGITTKQFGKICDQIISNPEKYPKTGLYHVHANSVSKYEMLQKAKQKFGINCVINQDHNNFLNRTLSSKFDLSDKLGVPTFDEMIDDF